MTATRFRKQFFPAATARDWNDWRWQLRHVLKTQHQFERIFELSETERAAIGRHRGALPVAVTPYYASLLDSRDPADPLRRTMIPTLHEFQRAAGEYDDPLGETAHSPVDGIVHTYRTKVLFLVTDFCATYCRYCTRARLVGSNTLRPIRDRWRKGIAYIEQHPEIRDVLLSGGDPLTLSDDKLEWILTRLRRIPHVEIIRIGSKVPAVLPQRVTPAFVRLLARFHPLWISVHFTHPDELTAPTRKACTRLADRGIPLMNQSVLLAGVNDNVDTIRRLNEGLLRLRVKPYYLHQCDAISGSAHFRTSIESGLEIIAGLHGNTTGYAVPLYMLDAPGGGGKVPMSPEYIVARSKDKLTVRGHQGQLHDYVPG